MEKDIIVLVIDIVNPGLFFTGFVSDCIVWSTDISKAIRYNYSENPRLIEETLKLIQLRCPSAALINENDKTLNI